MATALRIAATTTTTTTMRGIIRPFLAIAQLQPHRAFSLSWPRPKNSIGTSPQDSSVPPPPETSSTNAASGPLPTFAPTSSPELDVLLSHLRKEMFIEPHLLERQRVLTHKKKNHALLEEDPIHVPIGDQTVPLTPKVVHNPISRRTFTKAVQMMTEPSDFDALPGLVLGFTQSGQNLQEKHIAMAVRKAGFVGRTDVLLRILEQAEFNKIRIPAPIAREGFRGFTVLAKLPSKRTVIKAVKGARYLRNLLGQQDSLALGEYKSAVAALEKAGKTQRGIESELGSEPVGVTKDPVALGTLAGVTSMASKRFNEGLDHGGYTAEYIKKMFKPEIWDTMKKKLQHPWNSVYDATDAPYDVIREAFHDRRADVTDLNVLIDSLQTAEEVLNNTATLILNPPPLTPATSDLHDSLLNPKHGLTKEKMKAHAVEVAALAKRLRLEIPLMQQTLAKWIDAMADDGVRVMNWTPDDTRFRMDGTKKKYDWAAGELVKKGVGVEEAKA